jgi:iron complex transport system permease protein
MNGRTDSRRNIVIILVLAAALVGAVVFSFFLGRYPISPAELVNILFSRIFPIKHFWTDNMETVLFNVRLPRIFLGCIVGCSLSAAGAAYQGIFRNPMAAPDILGASAGAAFGAALAFLNDMPGTIVTVSAFFFSLLCVAIVYFVSTKAKGSKILGLVLSGIMVSSLFTAGTSYIKLVADPQDQLPKITYWLLGSLAGTKMNDVIFAAGVTLVGLIPLLLLRWRINVLTFGDDEARTMGISAKRIRLIVILCSTLVTAASVSVSGMIGWVGLVIPHLTRRLVGSNYRYLLPATMLSGAIFLLAVDNISRNLLSIEIPIGILTAFVGAPFFIYLITREGGQE